MKKGDVVIGDSVSQYLATLGLGKKPKLVVAAKESQGLRVVYPLINRVGEVESLLDSGSQIILMARNVAKNLEVNWDLDITIEMESTNRSVEKILGLAKSQTLTLTDPNTGEQCVMHTYERGKVPEILKP